MTTESNAKQAAGRRALAPIDPNQRYAVGEAILYLRTSRARFYQKVAAGDVELLKDGRRSYVHGAHLIRASQKSDARQ